MKSNRVCPWWLGPLLCCPLRRWFERAPEEILTPHIKPGMTVLEPGAGMGWFTLPMARMVGPEGKIVCPDLQPQMVRGLQHRARRAGLADRIDSFVCTADDLGIGRWNGRIDAAVAIHMVHEVPDRRRLLDQLHTAVRPGGTLLVVEPSGHVTAKDFDDTIASATAAGFELSSRETFKRDLCAAFRRG